MRSHSRDSAPVISVVLVLCTLLYGSGVISEVRERMSQISQKELRRVGGKGETRGRIYYYYVQYEHVIHTRARIRFGAVRYERHRRVRDTKA